MISDMEKTRDKSQYGNEKGISVNHYLIKMINEIVTAVDKNSANEKFAVFVLLLTGGKHLTGNAQHLV